MANQTPAAPGPNGVSSQDASVASQPRYQEGASTSRSTEQLRYPEGVGTPEQPHWLKILIRVREQNSQARGGGTTGGTYTETSARRADAGNAGTTAAIVGASAAGGGSLTEKIPLGNLLAKGGRALAGLGAATISGSNQLTTLAKSICLGLQEPPRAEYSTTWEEQALGAVLSGGKIGAFNIAKGIAGEAMLDKINPSKKGELLTQADAAAQRAAVTKGLGKIKNPYREQIFKQVEFRTFTFEYTFLPGSVAEAQNALQIIKILRQNMLPEVAENAFYLIYPSEFSLYYMYQGSVNTHVHQFSDCVLTNMTVKYGGQDFVTFKNSGGVPADIVMSLTFREIVPITGDRVANENL